MSFQEIHLSPLVLAGLYKHAVISLNEEKTITDTRTEPRAKFLGGNKKRILILVKSKDAVFVNDRGLFFLIKLLEACKMNIDDVAIVNNAENKLSITDLKKELQPKSIILFGCTPTNIQLPIEFPMFKLQEYDSSTYLYVPGLEELDTNTNDGKILKSKLWVCLKKLFDI
ncbi:MAG TPA: hypothetical protein VMT76_13650 [Puia sp.]|nr:hypothetical protein [Puia sp.]